MQELLEDFPRPPMYKQEWLENNSSVLEESTENNTHSVIWNEESGRAEENANYGQDSDNEEEGEEHSHKRV